MSDLRDDAHEAATGAMLGVLGGRLQAPTLELAGRLAADAVLELLQPVEDHIVDIGEHGFTVIHPLTERAAVTMHECELHLWLREQGGPPAPPGRYTATRRQHDPTSESFRSESPSPWDLEPIA